MPRRDDLRSVMVIGSGPIVIGQACEFDYSGTQACRVLKAEGLRVVLVNSNPATIMTDPEFADATYVEPITPEYVEKIIAKERPDALLATLGGQTALNCAMALHASGVLERYGVELIGANVDAIEAGENREKFKEIVAEINDAGLAAESARSAICHSMDDCLAAVQDLGYPVVVRPSFTMGGAGSGIAYDEADLHRIAGAGLAASPTTEVLLEESIIGWKEYELELMRDKNDNVVVICSIENVDPMGVHTGDSITVAPALTLTDRAGPSRWAAWSGYGLAALSVVGSATLVNDQLFPVLALGTLFFELWVVVFCAVLWRPAGHRRPGNTLPSSDRAAFRPTHRHTGPWDGPARRSPVANPVPGHTLAVHQEKAPVDIELPSDRALQPAGSSAVPAPDQGQHHRPQRLCLDESAAPGAATFPSRPRPRASSSP